MSLRRMMFFTLGAKIKNLIQAFKARVLSSQGEFEGETCLNDTLEDMGIDLFDQASLVITPNGYKENVLFSVTPSPVGTNLLLQSEGFTVFPWGLLVTPNITRTANAGTSPIGTNNATLLTSNSNNPSIGIRQNVVLSTNTPYVFSVWARSDNGAQIVLDIGDIGNTTFTLTTEWQRIQVSISSINLQFVDITFAANQLGKTCLIWGAQLEIGTNAGNYIPTTTRQAINETICDFTTTRATTGTRVNSDGLIEVVPYNLFSYSDDFSNSYWGKQRTTIKNNSITAPNGTMTADKVICNSGVTYSYIGALGVNIVSNSFPLNPTERVVSFYLKYGGLNRIRVMCGGATTMSGGIYVEVDLQLGIITGSNGGSVASNFFIEDAGNGWYRVGFTIIMTISPTNNRFGIGLGDTTKTVGDGVDGVFVWGAQLVEGTQPKDYFPTTNRFNVPRLDYTNGSCPSILVEPQRTNLIVRSEEFENASWQKNNISIIPNATISPSGLMNADKLVENNLLAHHIMSEFIGGTELRTNSIFVKAGERSRFILWAGACGYMFDLINLTTTPGNNAASISNTSIQDYGNGWYRCSITTKDLANNGFNISLLDNQTNPLTPTPQYQGDGVSGLYIWGAQRENAPSLTSYIPTTTAAVTRNADVITNTNAISLIGQTEGTIFIDYNKVLANDTYRAIISLNDGTSSSNLLEIWDGVGSGNLGRIVYIYYANNLGKVTGLGQTTVSPSGRYKICLTYIITPSLVNVKFFINGVKLDDRNLTYDAFSSPLSRINIGNRNGIGVGQGGHNLCFITKTRITDTQAIQLTTL